MTRTERMEKFVEEIWSWYARHKRVLPWRDLAIKDEAERAYRILVSEVMLQQTQVSRVIVIYKRFLRQFPRLGDLAEASNRDVILAWRGMGYNSRALRLRDAAKTIMERSFFPLPRGERVRVRVKSKNLQYAFPRSMDELTAIPGVGLYTAAAIRNFAFGIPTPCLDTNIRRILHRTFYGPENADGTWQVDDQRLLIIADEILKMALQPGGRGVKRNRGNKGENDTSATSVPSVTFTSAEWHAALMDFGSLVQTKNSPKWDLCPLTAAGIMKTTPELWKKNQSTSNQQPSLGSARDDNTNKQRNEPGRNMGGRFVPNRIFRGKIIEVLRDADRGLSIQKIGREICIDWSPSDHRQWLLELVQKLVHEGFVAKRGAVYQLAE